MRLARVLFIAYLAMIAAVLVAAFCIAAMGW